MGGIALVSVYIYSMVGNILDETKGEFPITPVLAGFALVAFNFLFSLLVLFIIPRFGRRTLGITSCIGMAFCNGSAALCLQSKWYMAAFISLVFFMASFSIIGAISYIYVGEVTVDKAAGLTMGFFCLGCIIVSFTAEYIMLWLTVPGTFYLQCAINLIYALIWVFSKESAGKSDKA